MMSPRLETIQLTIHHVRNGRNRVPVVGVHMGEGPSNSSETKAIGDPRIIVNILIIVVINELVPERLAKHNPDNTDKENADDNCDAFIIRGGRTGNRSSGWIRFLSARTSHPKE